MDTPIDTIPQYDDLPEQEYEAEEFPEVYVALERNMIPAKQTPWVESLTGPESIGQSNGNSLLSYVCVIGLRFVV